MASILVVSGKSKGYYYDLPKRATTIGREEGCDVQVLDDAVSRRHMEVRYDAAKGAYLASDLGSANGVHVNGRRISEPVTLQEGDAILIGESKLHFSMESYPGYDAALAAIKRRGEHGRSTLIR
jgi:pSer/pThr/pTyr-binding forkhead associated (FHA) protein